MSPSASSPTLETPVKNTEMGSQEPPSQDGLIIGITCGILGFLAVIIISVILGIKLRRKKKTRDDSALLETSSNSNAQLLTNSPSENTIQEKYLVPLGGEKRSTSCPDIYRVNQSILLKMGSTAHAYQQLEEASMKDSIRHKSEDYMALHTANISSFSGSKSKLSKEERDGKIFDDEGRLYETPSFSHSYRRQSFETNEVSKRTSDFLLITGGNQIPVYLDADERNYTIDGEAAGMSDYQIPTSGSPTLTPNSDIFPSQHENSEVYKSGYQTPTSNTPILAKKGTDPNENDEVPPIGYQTPTSNTPMLFPKSFNSTSDAKENNDIDGDDDKIYDVPILDKSTIPVNEPSKAEGSERDNAKQDTTGRYKTPLNVLPPTTPRSYSLGSSKEKLRNPDQKLYEVPKNNPPSAEFPPFPKSSSFHSQPSLFRTGSDTKQGAMEEERFTTASAHAHSDDMIYDVPSRCHTLDPSSRSKTTLRDIKSGPVNRYNPKEANSRIYNNPDYVDPENCYNNKNLRNSGIKPSSNHDYIDPDKCYNNKNLRNSGIKPSNNHDYIDPDKCYNNKNLRNSGIKPSSNPDYVDPENCYSNKNLRNSGIKPDGVDYVPETMYDVPVSTGIDTPPSCEDGTYLNVKPMTLEKRRSAGLMKKMGYDVPSTTPVFDPSQPSLLKLASQNLYKNMEASLHHQNKPAGGGRTVYDKQAAVVPEYDPSEAFSKTPINKKETNQGNRSMHLDEIDIIYDIPTNNKLATPAAEPPVRTSNAYDYDDDNIYQNVFHTEDGKPCLRTYKPSGER